MLEEAGRAGVMDEATLGHEAFGHGDPAPRALAVGKVGFRGEAG